MGVEIKDFKPNVTNQPARPWAIGLAFLCLIIGGIAVFDALHVNVGNWYGLGVAVRFQFVWLPLCSVLGVAMLAMIVSKTDLRAISAIAICVFLGCSQSYLKWLWTSDHRPEHDYRISHDLLESLSVVFQSGHWKTVATFANIPLALVIISIIAIAVGLRPGSGRIAQWVNRISFVFALIGLLGIASIRYRYARAAEQRNKEYNDEIAQSENNDETSHGFERCIWILQKGIAYNFEEGFDPVAFRTSKRFSGKNGNSFVWDDKTNRLIYKRHIFERDWERKGLLAHGDKLLKSPLMKAGPRPELNGGSLVCDSLMNCSVQWSFDVETLHASDLGRSCGAFPNIFCQSRDLGRGLQLQIYKQFSPY